MRVEFAQDIWDSDNIPESQRCETPGAMSPGLLVSDIPPQTDFLIMEYNDRDYEPLATNGGHGTLGFRFEKGSSSVTVPPVPEVQIDDLPDGIEVVSHNRGHTKRGYRAPCGGQDRFNTYEVIVRAVNSDDSGAVFAEVNLTLGKLK